MWALFSLLCIILMTAADIVGKKAVGLDKTAPLKLRTSVLIAAVITSFIMYALGLGESGIAPWNLALKHPVFLLVIICAVVSEFLYLLCLKYIGMSIMEAISGFEGIIIFGGLLLINLIYGKLTAVKDMLVPARLALICIVLVFTFVLPSISCTKSNEINATKTSLRRKTIIGVLIAFLAVIFGALDSLITDVVLDSANIGTVDYIMTVCFLAFVPLTVFLIVLVKQQKHSKTHHKTVNGYTVIYTVCFILQIFAGLYATSLDAVRSEIVYTTYPAISIIGAKIVLKEKYTLKQNICIWIITIATIAFCMFDYIV